MKKFLFISTILFLLIISSSTFAQSIEREPVTISSTKSKLEKANGWVFMDNGQWLNHQNQILFPEAAKSDVSHGEASLGKDNFISFEIREIKIQGQTYSLLIKKYSKGIYKYPKLKEDWEVFNVYDLWVFEKDKLNEILPSEITYNAAYEVKIKPLYYSNNFGANVNEIKDQDIINEVSKLMTNSKQANDYLKFKIFPVEAEGKKHLRFLYETQTNTSQEEIFDPKVFDKHYFEVDFDTFNNFINYN